MELLPSWVLQQKVAANRQVIAVMRQRLAAGEQVARMYQEPGLAWLERRAEAAEQLHGQVVVVLLDGIRHGSLD
ncbi:MAG TPA: hypothetical protein VFX88_22285 [Actinomycetota bacterium]|nr:hypothetical protein [Actinomycetota bacterium]